MDWTDVQIGDLATPDQINTVAHGVIANETNKADKSKMFYPDNQYGGIVSDNLNTISVSGFYTCYGTATGAPSTSYSWFVQHINSNVGTSYATQRAIAYSTDLIVAERKKISGTWGAWAYAPTNLVNGNSTGSLRSIYAKSDYTMGSYSLASGYSSTASGYGSNAIGAYSTASGTYSTAIGSYSTATLNYAVACGYSSSASGNASFTAGSYTNASGTYASSANRYTIAQGYAQTAIGEYNIAQGTVSSRTDTDNVFVIGNGTSSAARGNAFKVLWNGETYADGAYSSGGADYAEMFEWADGNPNNEDRVGYFVTLDGEKIKKANNGDYILGIVSSNPAILGDNPMRWNCKFLTDEWGRVLHETVTVDEEADLDGNIISEEHEEERPIINPDFDANQNETYEERIRRNEWDAVGMIGKLLVRDDGTCEVNGYCSPSDGGIATKSETGYRVMKRVSEKIILVLLK